MKSANKYTQNIKRIEFSVTYACNSRCRHCAVAERDVRQSLDAEAAASAVRQVSQQYEIQSVLTFGGEPLLCPDVVEKIHREAQQAGIPIRELITNGGLCSDIEKAERQADMILSCGINRVLVSVDTFHMEFIPLINQHTFTKILKDKGFQGLSLNPVWVASRSDDNLFNRETRECLKMFEDLDLPVGEGNVVRPEGKAKKYLQGFYEKGGFNPSFRCGDAPYTDRLDSPETICIEPNGDVSVCTFPIGNICKEELLEILGRYDPYKNTVMAILLQGGVAALQKYVEGMGYQASLSSYYSPCEFCSEMRSLLKVSD